MKKNHQWSFKCNQNIIGLNILQNLHWITRTNLTKMSYCWSYLPSITLITLITKNALWIQTFISIIQSGSQRQLSYLLPKAKHIYERADNNNPPGVAHNRNVATTFVYHDDDGINLIWKININKCIPNKRELSWLNI